MLLAHNKMTLATLVILTFLVSGCVVYPKKTEYFDQECQINSKKMELAVLYDRNGGSGCGNDPEICLGVYLGAAAATAIVSGSIVVIGNTIYWLQRKVNCQNNPVIQTANAPSQNHLQ